MLNSLKGRDGIRLRPAKNHESLIVGNSAAVKTGDAVVGIGNAQGAGGTPSYAGGQITAVNQSITASDSGAGTSEKLTGLLATNADIQPGESGGPLVNAEGQGIGCSAHIT